ncbi:diguanylate cyclase [Thiorhodococcus mannitoliphagus]|uniref:diguanylate cyclase n=1 Tax=Thiorhodococcus mannitoliphagus TaxID=329406 RepID=A0A6P1DR35_9GAMM|nr:diguanylate cyclase [Thiorhodococcus mannitoliphagus]NEX19136.1 diguanylate cyclase [Thiorhodococcus mannitoliphagus]
MPPQIPPSPHGHAGHRGILENSPLPGSATSVSLKLISIISLWLLIVAASLGWNLEQAERHRERLALEAARSFFQLLVLTRRWNAEHGGVYVPVTEQTQPNPYLKDPDRDIQITNDLTLTKVNPAYMTRQLSELAQKNAGAQFHITSLNPIRPSNAALPWEADALRAFERGTKEFGQVFRGDDQWGYRYMAPLVTEKPCLKCHADQGYREGDIRGGISVTLPRLTSPNSWALIGSHIGIALCGTLLILVMGRLLIRAYDGLRRQAVFDALTRIPNRRFFIEQLVHEMRRGRREHLPLALLICDIDYFKGYNDTFGHQAGDVCLQRVAELLQGCLRRGGDFCARYGGEEFVVILPSTELSGAARIGEQIRSALVELGIPHPVSPHRVITLSIGVACDRAGEQDHEALIRDADEALYRAKEQGRNRVEIQATPLTKHKGQPSAAAIQGDLSHPSEP